MAVVDQVRRIGQDEIHARGGHLTHQLHTVSESDGIEEGPLCWDLSVVVVYLVHLVRVLSQAHRAAPLWFPAVVGGWDFGVFAEKSDKRCSILIHRWFSFSAPDVSRGT